MPLSFNDIVSSLGNLSPSETRDLQRRLSFLSQFNEDTSASEKYSERETRLYASITQVLQSSLIGVPPWSVFVKTKHYPLYRRQVKMVGSFFDEFNSLKKVEQYALYNHAVTLVIELLRERGVLVALRTVISHLHLVPSLFDQAFPGYLAKGLLPFLVQALNKKK